MTVHAPVHPDASPGPRKGGGVPHELLDDVLEEEGSSKTQRFIAWLCVILTAAAAVAAWRLL